MTNSDYKTPKPYESPVAVHPGEFLSEILEAKNIKQKELASRMGRAERDVSEIICGKRSFTPETAQQLEYVLGIKSSFWINAQRNFEDTRIRLKREETLKRQAAFVQSFPYAEMAKFKLVPETRVAQERVDNLLSFFSVADFETLEKRTLEIVNQPAAARRALRFSQSSEKLAVWIRMGEIEAEKLQLSRFSAQAFKKVLPEIRSLTTFDPAEFLPQLKDIGERCGVGFLFIPEFKGFPFVGLTWWIRKNPIIQVNLRGKRSDILWFSLFHEIGHVFLHSDFRFILSLKNASDALEQEADKFAADILIPPDQYDIIVRDFINDESYIRYWAHKLGIEPGILLGRLQHEKLVRNDQYSHLHRRLDWGECLMV